MARCGFTCFKYLVFIFNIIFFLSGLVILGAGVAILVAMSKMNTAFYDENKGGIIMVIVIGCIITVVAFFGCRGAIKESYCNLMMFVVLLTAILILEVTAIIICYVHRDKIHEANKDPLRTTWDIYDPENDIEMSEIVDVIQQEFDCCGTNNASDWLTEIEWGKKNGYPDSCCKHGVREVGCAKLEENINLQGCLQFVKDVFENEVVIIAGIALGVACIDILGIVCACCLAKSIKRNAEEEELEKNKVAPEGVNVALGDKVKHLVVDLHF